MLPFSFKYACITYRQLTILTNFLLNSIYWNRRHKDIVGNSMIIIHLLLSGKKLREKENGHPLDQLLMKQA
jgi:hypothetical protein